MGRWIGWITLRTIVASVGGKPSGLSGNMKYEIWSKISYDDRHSIPFSTHNRNGSISFCKHLQFHYKLTGKRLIHNFDNFLICFQCLHSTKRNSRNSAVFWNLFLFKNWYTFNMLDVYLLHFEPKEWLNHIYFCVNKEVICFSPKHTVNIN